MSFFLPLPLRLFTDGECGGARGRNRIFPKIKKALKKGPMTKKDLEPVVSSLTARQPFSSEQIGVTEPGKFLDSILPYMIRQKMIREIREGGHTLYELNKK